MSFEIYNAALQKNIMCLHNYLGIIDFSQIYSAWTLHKMLLDKADVALQAILETDFTGKYCLIIFAGIELFFFVLCLYCMKQKI
jgi:hypothetical protein